MENYFTRLLKLNLSSYAGEQFTINSVAEDYNIPWSTAQESLVELKNEGLLTVTHVTMGNKNFSYYEVRE